MKKLSIHICLHVPFEGLGCIEKWINQNNHTLSYTKFYENSNLPNSEEIDWLIVMGGPMSVGDLNEYPWLTEEKRFILQAIASGKTVIGICLGSQLIADVLGSRVYPNKQKEIGWFDIFSTVESSETSILNGFESKFPVFHWHGDTFDLPTRAIRLFESETCLNQAFLYKENVLGLQFHFEVTQESMKQMVIHGANELIESETVQSAEKILLQTEFIESNNQKMFRILDYLQEKTSDC